MNNNLCIVLRFTAFSLLFYARLLRSSYPLSSRIMEILGWQGPPNFSVGHPLAYSFNGLIKDRVLVREFTYFSSQTKPASSKI